MTHYTIDYGQISDKAVARRKAINDAIRYHRRAVKIFISAVRAGQIEDERHAYFLLSFAGIQGFPARALWDYAKGDNNES